MHQKVAGLAAWRRGPAWQAGGGYGSKSALSRFLGGGGNKEEDGRVTRRRNQVPEGRGTGRTGEVGDSLKQSGKEAVTLDNPHETPALRQTQDAVTTNFVDTCRRRVLDGQPSTENLRRAL